MSQKTIEDISLNVRVRYEDYYYDEEGPTAALNNMCAEMSKDLYDELRAHGFDARRVPGQYLGMSETYEPDTREWEEDDIDAYEGDPRIAHWWVVCAGKIIDICADQFHPEDRQEYRIIIADEGDRDYEPMHCADPDLDADTVRPA